jgi:hypothetical protein
MKGERDIQSLAYLNRVLNMDPTRLTRQVYDALSKDQRMGTANQANWARSTVPKLLKKYNLTAPEPGMNKKEWRTIVRAAVTAVEDKALADEINTSSKLVELRGQGRKTQMPNFQQQRNSYALNRGRSIKTELRMGTAHRVRLMVDIGRQMGLPRNQRTCPCCGKGVEDAFHFTEKCPVYANEREEFHRCIECDGEDPYDILALKPQQRHRLLLGDGPEKGHENYARWRQIETKYFVYLVSAAARRDELTRPASGRPADRLSDRRGSMAQSSGAIGRCQGRFLT